MRILLAGASGFLGSALRDHLIDHGFSTRQLVRRPPTSTDEVEWDPYEAEPSAVVLRAVGESNVVINLAGARVARYPWTRRYRSTIVESRVAPSRVLAEAVASTHAPVALLNASAMGFYGHGRGDEVLTEDSEPGDGFLADVTRQWEAATAPASDAGGRVVHLRMGMVLGAGGGALGALARPMRVGVGGKVGDGHWWMSTASLLDFCRATVHLVFSELDGPVNVTGPEPVTNAEFADALARQLRRRAIVPTPSGLVRTFGRTMAQEILASQRVVPQRLADDGFVFADHDIEAQLKSALARPGDAEG